MTVPDFVAPADELDDELDELPQALRAITEPAARASAPAALMYLLKRSSSLKGFIVESKSNSQVFEGEPPA